MHLKQNQIQYSIFHSISYTNSKDKVPINKNAPNTKPEFLAISGNRTSQEKLVKFVVHILLCINDKFIGHTKVHTVITFVCKNKISDH
jgi:hypothetical protein